MFKTETHLHVSEVSPCARLTAAEMMKMYADAGYSTVFVSDHFQTSYFDRLGDMTWEEKIDRFLFGYEAAKIAGEALGLSVLLSAELKFRNLGNHYLLYGIDRDYLVRYSDSYDMPPEEYYRIAHDAGVTVIQAHPFRDNVCTPTPKLADGFEVVNTNPRHDNFNARALETAREYSLLMTSGSDAHRLEDVGLGGVISPRRIESAEDYIAMLRRGELELIGN